MWTTGNAKVASERFVAVLTGCGATGFTTYPIAFTSSVRTETAYVGFAVHGAPEDDLWCRHGVQFWPFHVSPRVEAALALAGVDGFVRIDE